MIESFNYRLFNLINATPESPKWIISLSTFIASYMIGIIPTVLVMLWLWGTKFQIYNHYKLMIKVITALIISMFYSYILKYLISFNRPFVDHVGYNFLKHTADSSFPSNHSTAIFTFALSFLFWHRIWSGTILMSCAILISWSRIYLGAHWPLDIAGSFIVSLVGCTTIVVVSCNYFNKYLQF